MQSSASANAPTTPTRECALISRVQGARNRRGSLTCRTCVLIEGSRGDMRPPPQSRPRTRQRPAGKDNVGTTKCLHLIDPTTMSDRNVVAKTGADTPCTAFRRGIDPIRGDASGNGRSASVFRDRSDKVHCHDAHGRPSGDFCDGRLGGERRLIQV